MLSIMNSETIGLIVTVIAFLILVTLFLFTGLDNQFKYRYYYVIVNSVEELLNQVDILLDEIYYADISPKRVKRIYKELEYLETEVRTYLNNKKVPTYLQIKLEDTKSKLEIAKQDLLESTKHEGVTDK